VGRPLPRPSLESALEEFCRRSEQRGR
jgi:hypothetical protein